MPETKIPQMTRHYRAASYARLSVDDDTLGMSNSIVNQLDMIKDFASTHPEIELCGEYCDDGFSGSSFDRRPQWNALLDDIEARKVNCIVVKDLSRIGRNYLEVSRYLDRIFPALEVRVIAINDGYDSSQERTSADALTLPMKNLFNDMLCRDASVKTKASLSAKRKRGEFVGSFAPYGYRKARMGNRMTLVVDEVPAAVVRWMFDCRVGGMSAAGIADSLNEGKTPTPYEYFLSIGEQRSANFCRNEELKWNARMVIRILENEVYIGTLIQGRTEKPDFRRSEVLPVNKDNWAVVENAHEAIIDRVTFAAVQRLATRDVRLAPGARIYHPLAGFVFCADCGATMARRSSKCAGGKRHYYSCETHRKDKRSCSMHKIWETDLLSGVARAVHSCAESVADMSRACDTPEVSRHDRRGELKGQMDFIDERMERSKELRLRMYSDYSDGVLSKNDYMELAKSLDARIGELKVERRQVKKSMELLGELEEESWEQILARYADRHDVDRVMVAELVERVEVTEAAEVVVRFRFGNPFTMSCEHGEVA